eukprot:COSAG04_NODE_450_length_14158_cov_17.389573_16_plen_75_part_00
MGTAHLKYHWGRNMKKIITVISAAPFIPSSANPTASAPIPSGERGGVGESRPQLRCWQGAREGCGRSYDGGGLW